MSAPAKPDDVHSLALDALRILDQPDPDLEQVADRLSRIVMIVEGVKQALADERDEAENGDYP